MTRFDLHQEALIERANRGVASSAELARLAQHLAQCAVCRIERALMIQAALDAAPQHDEELLVARLKRDVAARAAAPIGRRSKRKGALAVIALAAGAVASVAAAATFVIVRDAEPPQAIVATQPSQRPRPAALPGGSGPAKTDESRAVAADEAQALEASGKQGEPEVARSAAPAAVAESSSELFSRANQARRDGKVTEAVRLYRALQERFSGTSEELVSRVTLGRLLLDRLGDSHGALVQFNSYLASPGGGVLREEAMVGRALSLGRMGRGAEERAAWQALLDTFPKSTQRKRAQARLVELGGAADGAGRAGSGTGRAGRAE